jgi:hypothetical protein
MDQAQTLRKLMNGLEGRLFLTSTQIPVLSLVFASEDSSNIKTQKAFTQLLGSRGIKTLSISSEFNHGEIMRESSTAWTVSPGTLLRSPLDERDLSDRGIKAVLIDAKSGVDEERLCLYDRGHRTVVILTANEMDRVAAYQIIKSLQKRVGVKKVNVIVKGVEDEREGARVFTQLHELCCRFLDTELSYVGSISKSAQNDEKNQDRRFHPKFLLDYKTRSVLLADLEVVARRLGLIPAQ